MVDPLQRARHMLSRQETAGLDPLPNHKLVAVHQGEIYRHNLAIALADHHRFDPFGTEHRPRSPAADRESFRHDRGEGHAVFTSLPDGQGPFFGSQLQRFDCLPAIQTDESLRGLEFHLGRSDAHHHRPPGASNHHHCVPAGPFEGSRKRGVARIGPQ